MLSITIEDKKVENIFLKEFNSDKEKFFNFINSSYDRLKKNNSSESTKNELINLQTTSISKTSDNDKDKAWDELRDYLEKDTKVK